MSLETGEKQSEISRRERAIQTIIYIEGLERDGIHAHSLISNPSDNNPDASLLLEIDGAVIHTKTAMETEVETKQEPTFAERNRIITRRQSRRTVITLMQRANHPTRRRR